MIINIIIVIIIQWLLIIIIVIIITDVRNCRFQYLLPCTYEL